MAKRKRKKQEQDFRLSAAITEIVPEAREVKLDEIDADPERTKAVDRLVCALIRVRSPRVAFEASMLGASRTVKIGLARFLLEEKRIVEFVLLYGSNDLGESVAEVMALQCYKDNWFGQEEILKSLCESPFCETIINDTLKVYIKKGMLEAASEIVIFRRSVKALNQDELDALMEASAKKGDLRGCRNTAKFQKRDLTTAEIKKITEAMESC